MNDAFATGMNSFLQTDQICKPYGESGGAAANIGIVAEWSKAIPC